MSIAKRYSRELRDETNYSATWFPNVPVAVGDVGRMSGYQWNKITTLAAKQIHFETEEGSPADITYYSRDAVKASVGATASTSPAAQPVGLAQGALHIEFGREGAVVFEINGSRSTRMRDIDRVGQAILGLYQGGEWEGDLVVITEVVSAQNATILISNGNHASIDLTASGNAGPALGNLAKLGAELKSTSESNIGVRIIAATALTPLFRASAIKRRLLSPDTFAINERAIRHAEGAHARGESALARADYEDFEI